MFGKIFRAVDATRRFIINMVFILVMLMIVIGISRIPSSDLPDQAILVVNPVGSLTEQLTLPAADAFPLSLPANDQVRMRDLIRVIRLAKDDTRIRMMVLDLANMNHVPLSRLQTLGKVIEDFKQSGKPVVAAADHFTQSQYYLAATANKVFLHPMGMVILHGFGIYKNYFKDALQRLHVNIHLFRAGNYKAAAEPLIRNDMSDADREASRRLIDVQWRAYTADIAAMRHIKSSTLQAVLEHPVSLLRQSGTLAQLALKAGLVDQLASRTEAEQIINTMVGGKHLPRINYRDYIKAYAAEKPATSDQMVGLIVASGMILDGRQPSGSIGGDSLADLLQRAGRDQRIKAVVLRIDSPGGSAMASEVIRKQVVALRKQGKPVIVSMGSVAASGAYWIAAAADEIWASPTTITGSIGVFGLFAEFHQSMAELGIHTDGVGTTPLADGLRIDRPMSPQLQQIFQISVDHVYDRFITLVAKGRNMDVAQVQAVAQGRVWNAVDAKRLGLVDQMGELPDAIGAAAKKAGISENFKLIHIEPERSLKEQLWEKLLGTTQSWFANTMVFQDNIALHAWHRMVKDIEFSRLLNKQTQIYAYCDTVAP